MAFNVSFRALLFLLAFVVILNFSQFIMNSKRPFRDGPSRYPFAFIDFKVKKNDSETTTDLVDLLYNLTVPRVDFKLDVCPEIPFGLGVEDNVSDGISKMVLSTWITMGGAYKPKHCKSRQKIAVIIPLSSGKHEELKNFTSQLHYFLIKQEAEYQIFVVEYGNKTIPFNIGHLSNVGFLTVEKQGTKWQCIIFHTANIVPTDSRNLYRCGWYPKQLVGYVEAAGDDVRMDKKTTANGIISITPKQLYKINGFSNQLFNKDEYYYVDFLKRLQWANYTLERSNEAVSKYKSVEQKLNEAQNAPLPSPTTPNGSPTTSLTKKMYNHRPVDGVSGLIYDLYSVDIHGLYTLIRVTHPIKPSSELFDDMLFTHTTDVLLNDVDN